MSTLRVTNLQGGSAGSAPNLPDGAVVTGVVTATSFSGSGANLTGIDATALKDGSGNVKIQANSDGAVVTGVLTATTGSFTSNVSVGGTLTYEDVTNIDSVGLITARSGIEITGNIGLGGATYGSSGQVLTSGGSGANATWTTISSSPETTGVANGAIADGNPVSVDADGKFSITKKTINANDPLTLSSEFNGAEASNNISTFWNVYDPNLKMVLVVYDDDNDGHKLNVSVGNVNAALGNASWARSIISSGNQGYNCAIAYVGDTAGQSEWITTSVDSSNQGWVYCGSTDGSTVTKYTSLGGIQLGNGTDKNVHNQFDDGGGPVKIVTDTSSTQNRTVLMFWKLENSDKFSSAFATLNGPSDFVWGSVVRANGDVAAGSGSSGYDVCYDSVNNKFVAVFNSGNNLSAQIATRSGTNTVTWGSTTQAVAVDSGTLSICYHEATGKIVCAYESLAGNLRYGYAVVGTVSGTTISWGTPAQFASVNIRVSKLRYDPNTENMVITYNLRNSNYDLKAISATVSGNSISFGTETAVASVSGNIMGVQSGLAYDRSAERFLCSYENTNDKGKNKLINPGSASTNLSSFIGFSNGAYTNGQTATVALSGAVDDAQVGLTTGTSYYVQKNGSLGTVADTPSIKAGVAIASDKLLIRS